MRLTRVEIEGYRSIGRKVDIRVERDVTILIGANDHGKTNILSAIEHLNPDKQFAPDTDLNWDRVNQSEEFPCLTFHLQLEESDRAAIAALSTPPEPASSAPPEAPAGTTAAPSQAPAVHVTPAPEGPNQPSDGAEDQPASEANHLPLQVHEIPEVLIVQRKGITGATQYVAGDVPLSLLEAFAKENLPRVEIIRPQEKIPDAVTVEDLAEKSHEFMRGILYYAGIDPDEASELFTQDDVSMKQLKEASVTLNDTLKADWIQGADLRYELSHESAAKQILLRIEDPAVGSRLVRASRRSSGFTHFFTLKTVLYARQKDYVANAYIFLFDEPGIYLHPSGQHDLLRVLDAIGKHNQVIYSTHSLFMLNRTFPARHRLIVKNGEGTRIDGKPFVGRWGPAIEELGFSLAGTILFAQHVLLAEGDADPVLIQALFQKLVEWGRANADLNAFSVISTGSSKNTDALIRILREGSNAPSLLVVVDGDEGGSERLRVLKPFLAAHDVKSFQLQGGTTIEDHLPSAGGAYVDAVARYVAGVVETLGKGKPTRGEIQERLCKAAETKGYSENKVTAGIANWVIEKARAIAELRSNPSKLGIAREYVESLTAATADSYKKTQLKRGLELLRTVQSELSIPELREPAPKVTTD